MPSSKNASRKPAASLDERRLYWELGYRVRVAREAINMTQGVLAQRAGLSRTSVVNLEAGRQRSPLSILYHIAHALKTKPIHLLPALTDVLARAAR